LTIIALIVEQSDRAKMRAVEIAYANGPLELFKRDIPEPGPGQVRIKVEACGICHSDSFARERHLPRPYRALCRGECFCAEASGAPLWWKALEDLVVDQRTFNVVAGVIFAVVALLHLLRIYMGWPIVIGSWTAPMWVSWIGLVVAGGLSYFGLSLAARS
jgi:hypothetical protein